MFCKAPGETGPFSIQIQQVITSYYYAYMNFVLWTVSEINHIFSILSYLMAFRALGEAGPERQHGAWRQSHAHVPRAQLPYKHARLLPHEARHGGVRRPAQAHSLHPRPAWSPCRTADGRGKDVEVSE
jgi:hypothetical protein